MPACRGIVAREALSAAEQLHAPCIAVPARCELTAGVAARELGQLLAPVGLLGVERLDADIVLPLFLAYERRRGAAHL